MQHHWGGGKAAQGVGADLSISEVSWLSLINQYAASLGRGKGCIRCWGRFDQNFGFLATKNSHILIMGKMISGG